MTTYRGRSGQQSGQTVPGNQDPAPYLFPRNRFREQSEPPRRGRVGPGFDNFFPDVYSLAPRSPGKKKRPAPLEAGRPYCP